MSIVIPTTSYNYGCISHFWAELHRGVALWGIFHKLVFIGLKLNQQTTGVTTLYLVRNRKRPYPEHVTHLLTTMSHQHRVGPFLYLRPHVSYGKTTNWCGEHENNYIYIYSWRNWGFCWVHVQTNPFLLGSAFLKPSQTHAEIGDMHRYAVPEELLHELNTLSFCMWNQPLNSLTSEVHRTGCVKPWDGSMVKTFENKFSTMDSKQLLMGSIQHLSTGGKVWNGFLSLATGGHLGDMKKSNPWLFHAWAWRFNMGSTNNGPVYSDLFLSVYRITWHS